jgi:hypothetical protein
MTFGRRAPGAVAALAALLLSLLVTTGIATAQSQPDQSTGQQEQADQPTVQHSWALGPAGSADPSQPGNRQSLAYDVAPGSTIEDAVTLYNFGNVPLPFRVYATDAFNRADGQVDLLPGDEEPTDVGSWVAVGEERLTVQPGQQVTIPVTITVPADARPGDHVGAMLASSPIPGRTDEGATLNIDRRIGPDLLVRVQGPITPEVTVEDLSVSYSPSLNPLSGSAEVTYTLHNTGNVRLKGTHHVTMGGPFGLGEASTEPIEFSGLLPGESIEVRVPVDGVPASVLSTATVHVEMGEVANDEALVTETASTSTLAIPVSLVAIAVLVILALFARSRFHRQGKAGSGPSGPGAGGTPPGLPSGPGSQPRALEPAGRSR